MYLLLLFFGARLLTSQYITEERKCNCMSQVVCVKCYDDGWLVRPSQLASCMEGK